MKRVGLCAFVALSTAAVACGTMPPAAQVTTTVTETSVSTVTGTPPVAAPSSTPVAAGYTGNGVFAVGAAPRGGLSRSIPPGRYAVTINDNSSGSWMRCRSELCGLEYTENVITIGNPVGPNYSAVLEVEPTDAAIWLFGITLTPVR